MLEYAQNLPPQEAEELKRAIRDLMRQSCILETKYDASRGILKDNPRYRLCQKHRDFLIDYFDTMGAVLNYDPQDHFFRLTGEGVAAEKFSETTTLILLLMKLIYKEKIMGDGLMATMTNLKELRQYGSDTGLITRRLTDRELYEAMSVMKTHQMAEFPCALSDVEDDTPIYLYNMINVFCQGGAVSRIFAKYQNREKEKGESDAAE